VRLLALLFERPKPVGFFDKQVRFGRCRYQLRAFLAEVIETTAHRLALDRVHVEGVVGYLRREAFELSAQTNRRSEVTSGSRLRRSAHHPNAVADHQPGFTGLR
jgi:hypothetical protein